ncbi:hypothetical protein [Streptomyces sp. NPDC091215]|uniref:hypothetical protein n=1 Tax=Streptomyces sp. NPDC091215 TaxID=3155192 RepID=UPI003436CE8B
MMAFEAPAGRPRLRLPAVRPRRAETYARAAGRLVRAVTVTTGSPVCLGTVTARIPPAAPGGRTPHAQGERRLFTAHTATAHRQQPDGNGLMWIAHTHVASHVSALGIPDLGLFLGGYVEGWIPDGWITLDHPAA